MAAISVGWSTFNENKPFGDGTVIGGDNILHGRMRYEAVKAKNAGRATPEQELLVLDADMWYENAMKHRGK